MKKYGIVLLAAGASTRLGQPKQLLAYKGRTLIQHMIHLVSDFQETEIRVVLGANFDEIIDHIDITGEKVLFNEDWENGLSTSIKRGLLDLTSNFPDIAGVMFVLCDQPFVNNELLQKVFEAFEKEKQIAACFYDGILGTPAMFDKSFFEEILALKGDKGAGMIIKQHRDITTIIPFEDGSKDIDTFADLRYLW